METAKKGKPFGFYVCALGFTFERMAFYTVKYLLAIWLATKVASGGLGLTDVEGSAMSANFVAWTYITPMIGGYVADHWISPRLCVQLGMLLMGLGYICAGMATDLKMVWVMVILVAVGTGLFKGNLSGVNGLLFSDQDELDEAFSIQYSFVNVGSFIGTTFIAVLATNGTMSFTGVFTLCGIFLLVDLVWFTIGGRSALGELGKTPFKKDAREFVSEGTGKCTAHFRRQEEGCCNCSADTAFRSVLDVVVHGLHASILQIRLRRWRCIPEQGKLVHWKLPGSDFLV